MRAYGDPARPGGGGALDYHRFVGDVRPPGRFGPGDDGGGTVLMLGHGERGTFHVFPHRLQRSAGGTRPAAGVGEEGGGGGPLPQRFYVPSRATTTPVAAAAAPAAILEALRRQVGGRAVMRVCLMASVM